MGIDTVNNQSNGKFYLELSINDQAVLLSLNQVEIVLPMAELQSVPDKSHLLQGVLNYHGTAVPVYDLAQLLDLDKTDTTINTPLLLLDINGKQVGVFLKEVLDVLTIEEDEMQSPSFANVQSFVNGIYEKNNVNAWRLDLNALFQYHNLQDEGSSANIN